MDALDRLFGSSARVKLLRAFFFNPEASFTSAELAKRINASPERVRAEINTLLDAGILKRKGQRVAAYAVDRRFPHFEALDVFIRSTSGARPADLAKLLKPAGPFRLILLSGFFTGLAEASIDLLVVGDALNDRRVAKAVSAIEAKFGREIRYAALSTVDFRYRQGIYDRLIRDILDYPHRVVLDTLGL